MKRYSAITEMLYGRRGDSEFIKVETNGKTLDLLIEKSELFNEKVKELPEIATLFKEIVDLIEGNHCKELEAYYAEGFRFGALMAMDIMEGR